MSYGKVFNKTGTLGDYAWKQVSINFYPDSSFPTYPGAFGLKENGTLWHWNHDYVTASGPGTLYQIDTPSQIGSDTYLKISDISTFESSSYVSNGWANYYAPTDPATGSIWAPSFLAISSDGKLWMFYYSTAIVGANTIYTYARTQIAVGSTWTDVAQASPDPGVPAWTAAAIKSNGTLWAMGDNSHAQLGQDDYIQFGPGDVNATSDIITYNSHGFTDGTYVTYSNGGGTTIGGLSNGENYAISDATANTFKLKLILSSGISGSTINFTGVGSGTAHKLTQQSYSTLKQVGVDTTWTSVKINIYNMWALKNDGTVHATGLGDTSGYYNTSGVNLTTPTQLAGGLTGKTVEKIVAHTSGASALVTVSPRNEVYSWGSNFGYGQDPTNTDKRPTQITYSQLIFPLNGRVSDIGSAGGRLAIAGMGYLDGTWNQKGSYVEVGSAINGLLGNTGITNWVTLNGSDTQRTGSDWLLGTGPNRTNLSVIQNFLKNTLSVTDNLVSNDSTTGSVTLNSTYTNASLAIVWGDGSANTTRSFSASTSVSDVHDYKPNIVIDSVITATVTASNPRWPDIVHTITGMLIYDSPYTPTFTTNKDGSYSFGGYLNFSTTSTSPSIAFTNTTSAEPGATSTFANNRYRWYWGDGSSNDLNIGAGLAGTPGNGAATNSFAFTPAATPGKKVLTLESKLQAVTKSTNSPFNSSTKNFKILREPALTFTLDNANNDSIVSLTNTSLYADNYTIHWQDPSPSNTIVSNAVAGGSGGAATTFDYYNYSLGDGPQSIYLRSNFNELNNTFQSSTQSVNVFLPYSPTITSATNVLVRPQGSTNTGTLTFTNNPLLSSYNGATLQPGVTATYPSHEWRWTWDDGQYTYANVQVGLAGNSGTNITKNIGLSITNGVGVKFEYLDVVARLTTSHPSSPFDSNTHRVTVYLEPVIDFTLATSGNQLEITNTSLNADSYTINVQKTTSVGVTTETINIPSNAVAGGSGQAAYTIPVTFDTNFSVTMTATFPGNATTYSSSTKTLKVYAATTPTFNITSLTTLPYPTAFTFNNTSVLGKLGFTSDFVGNKWRWEWGDGTFTDVVVGTSLAGDIDVPITKSYTLTGGQIVAAVPVVYNVVLKGFNGHSSSPVSSISKTVTIIPVNPSFPNRVITTLDDANIPDIVTVRTTQRWGVTGGGNT